MGMGDKIKSKAEEMLGKTQEAAGSVTGSDDLKSGGKSEQTKSQIEQTGEGVKDAFKG